VLLLTTIAQCTSSVGVLGADRGVKSRLATEWDRQVARLASIHALVIGCWSTGGVRRWYVQFYTARPTSDSRLLSAADCGTTASM